MTGVSPTTRPDVPVSMAAKPPVAARPVATTAPPARAPPANTPKRPLKPWSPSPDCCRICWPRPPFDPQIGTSPFARGAVGSSPAGVNVELTTGIPAPGEVLMYPLPDGVSVTTEPSPSPPPPQPALLPPPLPPPKKHIWPSGQPSSPSSSESRPRGSFPPIGSPSVYV